MNKQSTRFVISPLPRPQDPRQSMQVGCNAIAVTQMQITREGTGDHDIHAQHCRHALKQALARLSR